ncbi:alpha/beta hydrolase [Cytobacillus suaedae]|nr:alpha/beta hydrolase [Cytobacillus suaedae]
MSIIKYNKNRSVQGYLLEKMIPLFVTLKKDLSSIEETERFIQKVGEETIEPYQLVKVKLKSDIIEDRFENMQVFTLNNKNSHKQKVILYLHGGAHVNQPVDLHWKLMDKLACSLDAKIIAPIYPKVPHFNYQHTYPTLVRLYKSILDSIENSNLLTLMGDSAGGNISLSLAQSLRDHELPQPKDIILLSPCVDMVLDNPVISDYETRDPMLSVAGFDVIRRIWAADKSLDDPVISPIYGDFNDLGKISFFIGTYEGLYPDVMKLDKMLTEQGIDHSTFVYPKMNHVFVLFPIPEARDAINKMTTIINS